MAYDPATRQVVLFGGFIAYNTLYGDTWTWDGRTWTQQSPSSSPSPRYGASMAYDAATGQIVLFGGFVPATGSLSDTWIWNGSTWTQQSPSTSPSNRVNAGLAYDAVAGQLVLFGGGGNTGILGDTWTWNGMTWTQQSPSTSPPARSYTSMAYDAAVSRVVLFGGGDNSNNFYADTWTWNGSTWTQQSPATSPSARYLAGTAYDTATRQVVLFGGNNNVVNLGDTWTWNGTSWTQLSPANSPSGRNAVSMVYDAATGQILLFGGYNTADLGDTWTMGAANPVPSADRGVLSLALTFDSAGANITTANNFWLAGGSVELNATVIRGFGLTASITGLHTGNSGGGVPVNLVMETFGPSYSLQSHLAKHPAMFFVHGLIGEANGFNGVYPKSTAPDSSANGLAAKVGGGLDLKVSHHISVRLIEANWLRTQLPNSTTNIQNDLELGAGMVFRIAKP
jgi:hypothetical protein